MSHTNYLSEFLNTHSYNLKEIRHFLECDNSSINKKDSRKRTPLLTVLIDSKCSIDIVRLLLQYGADVNVTDEDESTPLLIALKYSRDEAIISALLEKGANIDVCDFWDGTPLLYTFCNRWRKQSGKREWKENVLNLLLDKGLDLNKVDADGQSPLCYALKGRADVPDIELLLSKGGSLNACQEHTSPLHCVTKGCSRGLLKASVVQLLLDKHRAREGEVNEMDLQPLQNMLKYCLYETAAVKLLLEHSGENAVNSWIRQANDVLHLVVGNRYCKTSIVKLFLQKGARIDKLDACGKTVLHSVMRSDRDDLSVIEFLLKSGAPVNVECKSGRTPLSIVISQNIGYYVTNLLLVFGARISTSSDRNGVSMLKRALDRYSWGQEEKCIFKTLVKYYFLEFPGFNIQALIEGHCAYESLSFFAAKCTDELQRLESKNVRSDCTLRRFISENFLLSAKSDQEKKVVLDDCNQLLQILYINEFPEYFDVVASKILASQVSKVFLKKNLQELVVYTVDHCPVNASLIKKVVLNNDCVHNLAIFLSDEELLRLIVAFYHGDGATYSNNNI